MTTTSAPFNLLASTLWGRQFHIKFCAFAFAWLLLPENALAQYTSPPKTMQFNFLEQTISFQYHRLGKPTDPMIIVLGGGPGFTSWNLEPIQKIAEKEGYQSLLMDMFGIGENRHHTPDPILPTWTAQIHALKTRLTSSKTILIGHSWGALMAMKYAQSHPDHVSSLILLNPVEPNKSGLATLTETLHKRRLAISQTEWDHSSAWNNSEAQSSKTNAFTLSDLAQRQITQVLPFYFYDYQLGRQYATLFSGQDFNPKLNIEAWKAYDRNPVDYAALRALNTPTHFIGCDQDPLMPNNLQALRDNLTLTSTIVLSNCGHFPWVEQREAFQNQLIQVIRSTRNSSKQYHPKH